MAKGVTQPARPKAKPKKAGAKPAPAASSSGAAGEADAAAQLDGFLARYDPAIAAFGAKAIAHFRKRLPGAVTLVYDNYNALAVGFGPTAKPSAIPISVALYPRWVTLFFMWGGALDDPDGLLEGKGARIRSIRLDSPAMLKDARIDALVSAAVLHAGWTLDPKTKGRLVIQSVSPKQRPRRP